MNISFARAALNAVRPNRSKFIPKSSENIRVDRLSSSYNNATLCSAIMSSSKLPFRLNNFQSNARGGGKLFLNCTGHRNAVSRFNRSVSSTICSGCVCAPFPLDVFFFFVLAGSTAGLFLSSSSSSSSVPLSHASRCSDDDRLSLSLSLSLRLLVLRSRFSTGLDEAPSSSSSIVFFSICRRHRPVAPRSRSSLARPDAAT